MTSSGILGFTRRPVPRWVARLRFTVFIGVGVALLISGIRAFTFAGPESGNPVTTGDPVRVSYDPGNPAVARDMSAGAGNAWMLIGFGTLAILAGAGSFLFPRRPR